MTPRPGIMTTTTTRWFGAAAVLLAGLAGGCAGLGERPSQLAVVSDPAGAEVHVMGAQVGVTPLLIDHRQLFPATYPPAAQAHYGSVELRRDGCRSVTRTVSSRDLARGLDIRLDCAPGDGRPRAAAVPAAAVPSTATRAPAPAPAAAASGAAPPADTAAIEARLRRVQELRERGVISEAELQAQRRRILGEL